MPAAYIGKESTCLGVDKLKAVFISWGREVLITKTEIDNIGLCVRVYTSEMQSSATEREERLQQEVRGSLFRSPL